MLNKERRKKGLSQLFFQKDLRKVARKHSLDMAKQDYFAHESLDSRTPKDRFVQSGISEVVSGENLAKVRGYSNPVKTSHVGLMNSPGHRANILSKNYNCVGIGGAISDDKTYYFTQNFSHRVLILGRYPSRLRFRNHLVLKGKCIDRKVENVLLRMTDHYGRVDDLLCKIDSKRHFHFDVQFPKSGIYKFELYAGKNNLSICNHFEIHKKGFLW